jgi:hypothetical protein
MTFSAFFQSPRKANQPIKVAKKDFTTLQAWIMFVIEQRSDTNVVSRKPIDTITQMVIIIIIERIANHGAIVCVVLNRESVTKVKQKHLLIRH